MYHPASRAYELEHLKAVLPRRKGARLIFGKHRLLGAERYCKAWPENPDASRKAAYTRWIKGAMDQVPWHPCAACGGPVTVATGGRRMSNNEYEHDGPVGCLAHLTAHPMGPQHGPNADELLPRKIETPPEPRMAPVAIEEPARKAERGYRPAPCNRCGRNDFSTDKGRAWHLANNASCANRRKPERHTYTMIGG